MKPQDKVGYGYLNIDTKRFYPTQAALADSFGRGATLRAQTNDHGQVLIAGSRTNFTDYYAGYLCRKLTGVK